MILLFLYFFVAFICANFLIVEFLYYSKKKYPSIGIDITDAIFGAFFGIFGGLIWPVTIWISVLYFIAREEIPITYIKIKSILKKRI